MASWGQVADEYRASLGSKPRVHEDLSAWSATELIRRSMALGATDAAIDACVGSGDSAAVSAALAALVDGVRAGRWAAVTLSKSGAAVPPLAVWEAVMVLGMAVGVSTTTPRRFPSHHNG